MKNRIIFVGAVLALLWCCLVFRGVDLQLLPHEKLSGLKERIFETTVKINPRRGVIYDRKGQELALSIPSRSLFADPQTFEKPYYAAKKLSGLFNRPQKFFLKKLLNKKRRFVWIKRHLSPKEIKTIQSWKLKGLHFIQETKRFYTEGPSLSQVLGFTGIDGQGLEGIEKQYEEVLKGVEQRLIVKRDARGRPLFAAFTSFIHRMSGSDVYLTIDRDTQVYFERELSQAVKKSSARFALGVILSVETNEILAMVNVPNYNPNHPLTGNPIFRRNRTVTDIYEPGSTLKTFTLASALENGIPPSKSYSTHDGAFKLGERVIREADEKKRFDPFLNLSEILALSSNVGAAEVALDVGAGKLRKTLWNFGFGKKTGLEFPGDSRGILRPLPWRPIETATISFGHGIAATTLQIANAYSALARGGILKKPILVKKIQNSYTGEEKHFKTSVIQRAISENTAQLLILMLAGATEESSTGFRAVVPGHLTAGKTGTAQQVNFQKGGYKTGEYISSFAGFIPAHKPKFVIYIAINGAKDHFYASDLAAPVFSETASYAIRKAGLSPILFSENDFISFSSNKPEVSKPQRSPAAVGTMPDLKGLSLREVLKKVHGTEIKLKFYGSRRVIRTIPFAGQLLPEDKKVTVILN
ncbi:MAG: penicillin-binding transpeptidase domain-containing protein [Bdellovibrionales bacterium]|nr:penicillin-binding transpeptidase domain-containing protein [Bdellovibrionales bacterium]